MAAERSLGYLVRYAHRAFVRALAAELAPHGISTGEWAVFRVLWTREGYSQVELAQRMGVEKASLTAVLRAMERSGWLTRRRDPDDQRCSVLSLTPRGRALKRKLLSCGAQINRRAIAGMSASQVAQLRNLLGKVTTNLHN
jgi:DNA-binding MarR family transcriptional regulator